MEAFEVFLASMAAQPLAAQMEQCLKATWRTNERVAIALKGSQSGPPVNPADMAPLLVTIMGTPAPYPLPSKAQGRVHPSYVGPDGTEWHFVNVVEAAGMGAPGEGWSRVAKPGEGPGAATDDGGASGSV